MSEASTRSLNKSGMLQWLGVGVIRKFSLVYMTVAATVVQNHSWRVSLRARHMAPLCPVPLYSTAASAQQDTLHGSTGIQGQVSWKQGRESTVFSDQASDITQHFCNIPLVIGNLTPVQIQEERLETPPLKGENVAHRLERAGGWKCSHLGKYNIPPSQSRDSQCMFLMTTRLQDYKLALFMA